MNLLESLRQRLASRPDLIAALGFVSVALGAKLLLIDHFGKNMPFWDQWDAEAAQLYVPYLNGTLDWRQLIATHNEHRILFTRLLDLLLLEGNGLWFPKLQMVANAILHVAVMAGLGMALTRQMTPSSRTAMWLLVALSTALPFGWDNTLSGFQSQFYFVVGFSALSLYLAANATAFSPRWWAMLVAAVCAALSMSSGIVVPLAAVAVALVQMVAGSRRASLREIAALAVLVAGFGFAYSSVASIAQASSLKSTSLWEFVAVVLNVAGWPSQLFGLSALLQNLPVIALILLLVRRKTPLQSSDWFLVALMAWTGMQWLLIAYGRAAAPTTSRYTDVLVIGVLVNAAAAVRLAALWPRLRRPVTVWCSICGLVVAIIGLWPLFGAIPQRAAEQKVQLDNLRAYVDSGDLEAMQALPFFALPYPTADRLAEVLAMPGIVGLLHPDVTGKLPSTQLLLPAWATALFRAPQLLLLRLAPALLGLGLLAALAALGLVLRGRRTAPLTA